MNKMNKMNAQKQQKIQQLLQNLDEKEFQKVISTIQQNPNISIQDIQNLVENNEDQRKY